MFTAVNWAQEKACYLHNVREEVYDTHVVLCTFSQRVIVSLILNINLKCSVDTSDFSRFVKTIDKSFLFHRLTLYLKANRSLEEHHTASFVDVV